MRRSSFDTEIARDPAATQVIQKTPTLESRANRTRIFYRQTMTNSRLIPILFFVFSSS